MKITKVEALPVGQFLYARITTDEGLTGIGESGAWGHLEASRAAIEKYAEYLVGKDPAPIEHHWNVMQRFSHHRGAAINGAVSALDVALWDIKGKALGKPVYELLGGPVRNRMRVYGHVYGKTLDELVENAVRLKEMGFTALGHLNPLLDEEEDKPYYKAHARMIGDAADAIRRVREAVGDDVDILVEIHRRLLPREAIALGREIEPYRPMWYEDPLRPESFDAMAEVQRAIGIPVATGERFTTLYDFQQIFAREAAHYARASICICGGITAGKKIAAIAEGHNKELAPHNPLSPVCLAAALQLCAAVPNVAIQEFPTGYENMQFTTSGRLLGGDIVDELPRFEDGFVIIPDRPGIGLELLPDAQKIRPPMTKQVSMRPHRDGFIVDQ